MDKPYDRDGVRETIWGKRSNRLKRDSELSGP